MALPMLQIKGQYLTFARARTSPGAVPEGQFADVCPDGRCAAACLVAAADVATHMAIARSVAGYPLDSAVVQTETAAAKAWLLDASVFFSDMENNIVAKRFADLATGELANTNDFRFMAQKLRHRIVVTHAFGSNVEPPLVFGSSRMPTRVWLQQVITNGQGHFVLHQSWLPQPGDPQPTEELHIASASQESSAPSETAGSQHHALPQPCESQPTEEHHQVPALSDAPGSLLMQRLLRRVSHENLGASAAPPDAPELAAPDQPKQLAKRKERRGVAKRIAKAHGAAADAVIGSMGSSAGSARAQPAAASRSPTHPRPVPAASEGSSSDAGKLFRDLLSEQELTDEAESVLLPALSVGAVAKAPARRGRKRTAEVLVAEPDRVIPEALNRAMETTTTTIKRLRAAIAEAGDAISAQKSLLGGADVSASVRTECAAHLKAATAELKTLVKREPKKTAQKPPMDHRLRESHRNFGAGHASNMAPEHSFHTGDKTFFHENYTQSLNQRSGAAAAEEAFRKARVTTANMHWTCLRRWVGILKLQEGSAEPLWVKDILVEENAMATDGHKLLIWILSLVPFLLKLRI